jgi:hypothetical protein
MYTVYWIKTTEHTDAYSQGYVGISSAVHNRWNQHRLNPPNEHFKNAIQKHGWGNLIKQVIFTGSKEACLAFEKMLRPTKKVGWNLEMGGGLPPKHFGEANCNFGKFGEKHHSFGKRRKDVSKNLTENNPMHRPEVAVKLTGGKNGNATKIKFKGVIYNCLKDLAAVEGMKPKSFASRIHRNPAKYGYEIIKE